MITTDRAGNTLSRTAVEKAIADGTLDYVWSIRIIDQQGQPTNSAVWLRYQLDETFLRVEPTRTLRVDGTGEAHLSILADDVPSTVPLEQYHRIEIDMVTLHPVQAWPWFTGRLETLEAADVEDDEGVTVRTIEVECKGVLQRAKDVWLDRFAYVPPQTTLWTGAITGVCPRRRMRIASTAGVGGTDRVPFATTYDVATQIVISPNADMTGAYTLGDAVNGYTINATTSPATINWGSARDPAAEIWIECPVPERFGIPLKYSGRFVALPYGREPDDLFATEVSAYNAGTPSLTLKDPSGLPTLLVASTDLVTVTQASTGEELTRTVSAVSGAGVLTLAAYSGSPATITFSNGAAPVEGDFARISTTEFRGCWPDASLNNFNFFKNNAYSVRHHHGQFRILPNMGMLIPDRAYNFTGTTSDSVYITFIAFAYEPFEAGGVGTDNGAEQAIKNILTTGFSFSQGLFGASEVVATNSGTLLRNHSRADLDLQTYLKEVNEQALPPSVHIRDNAAGQVLIIPDAQKATADYPNRTDAEIRHVAVPDPVTAFVVRAKGGEENKAPAWYRHSLGYNCSGTGDDALRVIDGDTALECTYQTAGVNYFEVGFRVPVLSPPELYPFISKIVVYGRGYLSIEVIQDPDGTADRYAVPHLSKLPVGASANAAATYSVSEITIDGTDLISALRHDVPNDLIFKIYEVNNTVVIPPAIAEVKIHTISLVAYREALGNIATDMPAGWGTLTGDYGSIHARPDATKNEGWRAASSELLQRILPFYHASDRALQKHRTKPIELTGISQQDARTSAEAHLDEEVRMAEQIEVSGFIPPWMEAGDTVRQSAAPGKAFLDGVQVKNLFLWSLSGSAEGSLTMINYG